MTNVTIGVIICSQKHESAFRDNLAPASLYIEFNFFIYNPNPFFVRKAVCRYGFFHFYFEVSARCDIICAENYTMIKDILFDLDDTILDFTRAERRALTSALLFFGIEPSDSTVDLYHEINAGQWRKLEKGLLTRDEVKTSRYEILFEKIGVKNVFPAEMTAKYESGLVEEIFFVDGALGLLDALYGKYRLFLVSNGAKKAQTARIEKAGIGKFFDGIFISEEMGADKPSKEFFDRAFSSVKDFSVQNAVIVGDTLTSDIKGGQNFGIKTVWFNRNGIKNGTDIIPDYEITSISGLKTVLKDI